MRDQDASDGKQQHELYQLEKQHEPLTIHHDQGHPMGHERRDQEVADGHERIDGGEFLPPVTQQQRNDQRAEVPESQQERTDDEGL